MSQLRSELMAARQEIESSKRDADAGKSAVAEAKIKADTAWMLVSTALVLFMIPGLALFYGGMVRRKNVLATMMQSMACLSIVGLYWIAIGYALAFGHSVIRVSFLGVESGGIVGWSPDLVFLAGVSPEQQLPGTNIPIIVHVLFQGMFAIITPALISGALAERIRFWPFVLFTLLWVTFVYCPLAHAVWSFDWFDPSVPLDKRGGAAIGFLGKLGALDFAGGTVVHIAAGLAGLAAVLVLRSRDGYPRSVVHPNGMVLTLLGAGFLWFGWFGFNGGSALASGALAASAFAATQAAAAAAGLGWMALEWLHKGKPTALGLASGIVAGLVAVTPASGYVFTGGAAVIGLAAASVCYLAVWAKSRLGYDDSLDAFGIHGVGGFLGAVLTGVFCSKIVNPAGADGLTSGSAHQLGIQLLAGLLSAVFAGSVSAGLAVLTHRLTLGNFTTDPKSETEGLDRTEHGEVGFDFGYATETVVAHTFEPRSASVPKGNGRYELAVEGVTSSELMKNWSALCLPSDAPPDPDFLAVYPYITTVSGNRFRFRGGEAENLVNRLESLLRKTMPDKPVNVVRVQSL